MSANIIGKVRAMFNDNGRTPEEAATFHAKASEWCRKYNLGHIFAEEMRAKPKAKPKAKAKTAKAAKQPKDDGRIRILKIRIKGEKRWEVVGECSQTELKMSLKNLRAQGVEAKSEVKK